ncbi:hypothetical protein [Rubrivirga sp. IMCC45206]|uniref:hypothetical protein n=1 Tax=Rubrivirga sp. IMCC45206 TaxID=3391614 RepID=UPI00398FFF6D
MRLAAFALLAATAASAQTEWRETPAAGFSIDALTAVGGEAMVATDETGELVGSIDVRSSVLLVAGRVPVGAGWAVRAELPLAYASFRGPDGVGGRYDESDAAIGNPYLGVEVDVRPGLVLGAGVRLPLANDVNTTEGFGWQGGLGADIERFEAYVPEVLTVSGAADVVRALSPSARLRLRLAPAIVVDVADGENVSGQSGTGVLLGYGVQGEVDVRPVTLRAGLVGRPHLTGDRFEVFETTATALAGATVSVAGVHPGVSVRVPLDRDRFYLDPAATVGVTLDVPIR